MPNDQYRSDPSDEEDILEFEQYKPKPKPVAKTPPIKSEVKPISDIKRKPPKVVSAPHTPARVSPVEPPILPKVLAPNPPESEITRAAEPAEVAIPKAYAAPKVIPPHPRTARQPPTKPANLMLIALMLFALAGSLLIGLVGFVGVRVASQIPTDEAVQDITDPKLTTQVQAGIVFATPAPTVPAASVQIDPWNGTERFTILLLGLDKRPQEQGTAFRTDSMIIVSVDPKTHSVGMLSVPRDLYVEIPRDTVARNYYGLQRVNTAYYLGERVQEGYGPKLAMQAVQYNLGIRIHDYVVYDFEAVINGIDAIGGIEIDVPRDIVDYQYPDMNYGYETLVIKKGKQHMDGTLALKYARTRHDSSDLDRAKRQQQIINAIRDKVLDFNMVPELLVRAPGLWAQLSRHMRSGLTLDQLLRLAVYAKDIAPDNIRQGVIDYGYVQPVMWNGASVLVPNRASIGPLLVKVFGPNYNH